MAYNRAYIRQRVLEDKLDDTAYNAGVVDRFINDAQKSIFNTYELPFMEKSFAGALPEAGYVYNLPTDLQTVVGLRMVEPQGKRFDLSQNYIPYKQFNRLYPTPEYNGVGTPRVWTLFGGKIYFDKPTDRVYTLEVDYIKKAVPLTDDAQVPEIPEEFEEVLVLGTYYRVLQRNEDNDLAAYIKTGEYTDELDKMVSKLGTRQTAKVHIMAQPYRNVRRR